MIKKYKSVIWDWNGTLLNDVSFCVKILNEFLQTQNINSLEKGQYLDVFGFPISEYYRKLGVDFSNISYAEITKIFIEKYDAGVRACNLHLNVNKVLKTFNSRNINQYILTAAHKKSVITLLQYFSIESYFTEVEGLDNHNGDSKINRGKQLVVNNRIQAHEAVLIGDTDHDFEVAQHLGIDCILIANGHQSKNRLHKEVNGGCSIVDDLNELSNYLI